MLSRPRRQLKLFLRRPRRKEQLRKTLLYQPVAFFRHCKGHAAPSGTLAPCIQRITQAMP
jgi:hypothetical protein